VAARRAASANRYEQAVIVTLRMITTATWTVNLHLADRLP